MTEELFIGNNVIRSKWDTEAFVKARHQLRACIEKDTLYVQVVEQSVAERISSCLSHSMCICQNRTYAHPLKLAEIKVNSSGTTALTSMMQKILNSCCKLDEVNHFNVQRVLDDLKERVEEEMGHTLFDIMLINWQDVVNWLNNGLEQAKGFFQKEEQEKIEATKQSLNEMWSSIREQLDALDPETKQAMNLLTADQPNNIQQKQQQINAITDPFPKRLAEVSNYMRDLFVQAGQPFPEYQPRPISPDREALESGVLPLYIQIQEALEAEKEISPELISKRDAYIQELAQLRESIKTMTGKQAHDAIDAFADKHTGIIGHVLMPGKNG